MNTDKETRLSQIVSWNDEWLSFALVEGPFPSEEAPRYLKETAVTRLMELTGYDQAEAELAWDEAVNGKETDLLHTDGGRSMASICFDGDHTEHIAVIPYPEIGR